MSCAFEVIQTAGDLRAMSDLVTKMPDSDLEIVIGYDPGGKPNSKRAEDLAAKENLTVVYPGDDEVLIDIDNDHSFQVYLKHRDVIAKHLGILSENVQPSRNKKEGLHVTLKMKSPVTELERIAIQACLGSDRMREVLGFIQYKNGDPHPTLFLEKKPTP
jgi:hypothetical protein